MKFSKTILITGGAGFIGSHLVLHMVEHYPNYQIINLDTLTYASDISYLSKISEESNYLFVKGDINDRVLLQELFQKHRINNVIHLAAESHVDNSILYPSEFAKTNVMGTIQLLDIAHKAWQGSTTGFRFYHISTDEVFGSLPEKGMFSENTPYYPRSPYSASKASSDHFVRAYYHTYHLPILISNCSNNFGPHQHSEKLIPLFIKNILAGKKLPIYGKGTNIRDWLFVIDHIRAIDCIFHNGTPGESYAVGGNNEIRNIDLVHKLIEQTDNLLGNPKGTSKKLISFVDDRKGHDYRYAIDSTKLNNELGWKPQRSFEDALEETILWYINRYKS